MNHHDQDHDQAAARLDQALDATLANGAPPLPPPDVATLATLRQLARLRYQPSPDPAFAARLRATLVGAAAPGRLAATPPPVPHAPAPRRRWAVDRCGPALSAAGALVLALLVMGAVLVAVSLQPRHGDRAPAGLAGAPAQSGRVIPAPRADDAPTGLAIPAIALDAPVQTVTIPADLRDIMLENPTVVGWDDTSARPGAGGNVVLIGHLDYYTIGPAVFWDLGEVAPGDEVTLRAANGAAFTYVVSWRRTYQVATLSAARAAISGPTAQPSVTLITEAGAFDPAVSAYPARLVVRAELRPAPPGPPAAGPATPVVAN